MQHIDPHMIVVNQRVGEADQPGGAVNMPGNLSSMIEP